MRCFPDQRLFYRALDIAELWASIAFAATFFLTRVLPLTALVIYLFCNLEAMSTLLSTPLLVSYLVLFPALYFLNLFWAYKIFLGIVNQLRKNKRGPRKVSSS